MAEEKAKKPGITVRLRKFFRDLRSELKKVVWPSRKQVVNNTGIVIACVLLAGVVVWVLDAAFLGLLSLITSAL
ncbi:Protein translocase subunit SecE [bioreactor metagenome]|uniref:Protein translocase subunit SecE n=1 Tax=bioreactor metagenome TaxID=1076179 RepID=A0A645EXP5_9ZZZZ